MTISEKVAYLKGLADGMKLDEASESNQLILKVIDVLGDVAESVDTLDDDISMLYEQVDAIDQDLGDIEEDFYDFDDEGDEDEDELNDLYQFEVTCPTCGTEVYFDEEELQKGEIACPECGEILEFDIDEDESEADAEE